MIIFSLIYTIILYSTHCVAQYDQELISKAHSIYQLGDKVNGLMYQTGRSNIIGSNVIANPYSAKLPICMAAFIQFDALAKEGCDVIGEARRLIAIGRIATRDEDPAVKEIFDAISRLQEFLNELKRKTGFGFVLDEVCSSMKTALLCHYLTVFCGDVPFIFSNSNGQAQFDPLKGVLPLTPVAYLQKKGLQCPAIDPPVPTPTPTPVPYAEPARPSVSPENPIYNHATSEKKISMSLGFILLLLFLII